MTTKFYLHDAATGNTGTLPSSTHSSLTSNTSATPPATSLTQRAMNLAIGTSQASLAGTTQATVTAQAMRMGMWESAPLAAQTLPTGTWTLSIASSEANAASNYQVTFCLYVWRPSTGAMVGAALYDHVGNLTEPGTSETAATLTTASITGVAVSAGDILVLEIWRASIAQGGATARVNTFYYDGTTEASTTSCASFLLCNGGTLSFFTETSPALILSGFGGFTGVHSYDTINSLAVAFTHKEATGATAPTLQLWDGVTAQIGATLTGTVSAAAVTDTFTLTGANCPSFAQLGTLQVQVFGNSSATGGVESADAVGLTVNYTPGVAPQAQVVQAERLPPRPVTAVHPQVISGPVAVSGGTASAGLATASGTAQSPVPVVIPAAGLAAGTGTAQAPVPAVTASAGLAAGTGTAQPPVPAVIPAAGLAAGAGAALDPAFIVQAGLATAAGTAQQPAAVIQPSAGLAAGTGTAQPPVPVVTAAAGLAAGTGAAQGPLPVVTPAAGLASGTGTSQPPVPVVIVNAGLATGTGTALQPTVNTSGSTTANAGLASATGTALGPVPAILPAAGLASATGSAPPPAVTVTASASLATGTGTAQPPVPVITVSAGLATGTGTALNPTVNTSGSTTANAGLATGTGTAQPPVPVIAASAAFAPGTGTGQPPVPAVQPAAGLAMGTGTAQGPVPAIGASPALAAASGTVPQVITSVTVTAGLASASGSAAQPVAVVQVTLGPVAGTGTAQQPGITITVIAGLATGTGTAWQPSAGAGTLTAHAGLATATGTAWQPVIPGYTGAVPWIASPLPPRWQAAALEPRWQASPLLPRWRVIPVQYEPVSALSVEYIPVLWNTELAGTEIDPTGATPGQLQLTVQFAVPVSSGNPLMPAEPVTWYLAVWLTGTNIRGYVAQCAIGPTGGSPAGLVQLTAGTDYDLFSRILGTPEQPVKFAGTVSAY